MKGINVEKLCENIMKGVEASLNESYEFNGNNVDTAMVRDLSLYAENNQKTWMKIESLIKMLQRKRAKGVELSKTHLAGSSIIDKIVREAIFEYSREFGSIHPNTATRKAIKADFADLVFNWLDENFD